MSTAARRAVALTFLILSASALALGRGAPPPPQDPEDAEEAAYREALVRRSLQDNCLICHTEDMIAGQRLAPAQWKAEVEKMVNWGAPLPKEAAGPLVDYLARRYSDREPTPAPARATLESVDSLEVPAARGASVSEDGDPARGERLYAANCATCHGPAALGGDLGPALVGKAILDRRPEYDRLVTDGLRRMPGFQLTMKPRDQSDVLAWLRRRAYPEAIGRDGR